MSDSAESPTVTLIPPDDDRDNDAEAARRRASGSRWTSGVGAVALALIALVAVLVATSEDRATPNPPATPAVDSARPERDSHVETRVGDGPILGEAVGLVIAVGGLEHDIHVVDLDTGDVSSIGLPGEPQLIHDGHLLARDGWNRWDVFDLDEVDRDPTTPTSDRTLFTSAVTAEAGGVWLHHPGGGASQLWSRVDPTSGEVLDRVSVPAGADVVRDVDGVPLAGPEIVGSNDGAVYTLDAGGRYRLALDARLISFGEDLILVSSCDESLRCANSWIDRRSLDLLAMPAPEVELGGAFVRGGSVLVAETFSPSGLIVKVFDIASGRAIATGSPAGLSRSWMSPSGRFLAMPGFDALLITDVRDGGTTAIDGVSVDPRLHLVWGHATS